MSRALLIAAVLIAADLQAQKPCEAEYANAMKSISFGSYFSQDATRAMTTPLRANKLDAVDAAIDGPLMKAVPAETREALHGAVIELRRCLGKTPASKPFEDDSAQLRAAEIVDGVLPASVSSLTLRLESGTGEPIPVAAIDAIELAAGSDKREVTRMFTAKDGAITLTDLPGFTALLGAEPPLQLRVRAKDASGNTRETALRFAIGRHRPTLRLIAPPGLGSAASEMSIRLVHLSTELSFWQASDSRGRASFSALPEGGYRIEANSLRGLRLFAQQGFMLDEDKAIDVTLYAQTDGWARIERDGTIVPADAPRRYVRIAAMTVYAVDNTFQVKTLDIIDWPADGMDVEPREQELVEAEQLLSRDADAGPWRTVTVRAFDVSGQITHRRLIRVEAQPGHAENFRVKIPLKDTYRLEVQGWRPNRRVNWTLDELRKDPSIDQGKALFEPE